MCDQGHTGLELLLRPLFFPVMLWWQLVLTVTNSYPGSCITPTGQKDGSQSKSMEQWSWFSFEGRGFLWSPTYGLNHQTCVYSKTGERRAITRLLWTLIALLGKGGIKVRWSWQSQDQSHQIQAAGLLYLWVLTVWIQPTTNQNTSLLSPYRTHTCLFFLICFHYLPNKTV